MLTVVMTVIEGRGGALAMKWGWGENRKEKETHGSRHGQKQAKEMNITASPGMPWGLLDCLLDFSRAEDSATSEPEEAGHTHLGFRHYLCRTRLQGTDKCRSGDSTGLCQMK